MKNRLLQWALCLIMLTLITACSGNSKSKDLLKRVPASAEIVAVGDIQTILASAGGEVDGSEIKLPKQLEEMLSSSELDKMQEALDDAKNSGFDLNAVALAADFKSSSPVIILKIDDKKKLKKWLSDNDYDDEGEADGHQQYVKKTYSSSYDKEYNRYNYLITDGSYAYLMPDTYNNSDCKPAKTIARMIEDADEESFDGTVPGKYIMAGNAGGVAVRLPKEAKQALKEAGIDSAIAQMASGSVCFKADLDDSSLSIDMKAFDEEGNEQDIEALKKYYDVTASLNPAALAYLGPNEQLVMAIEAKDVNWSKYLDLVGAMGMSRAERQQVESVVDYLKKIDGTIAVGVGLKGGLESFVKIDCGKDVASCLAGTTVIETRDGKAKSLLADLHSFIGQIGLTTEGSPSKFTLEDPSIGKLYFQADGNFIILANHPISASSDNPVVKALTFSDYMGALAMALPKSDKLMEDLDVKADLQAQLTVKPATMEINLTFKIDGAKGDGFLAKALDIASSIYENRNALERKIQGYYERHRVYAPVWEEPVDTMVCAVEEYDYMGDI